MPTIELKNATKHYRTEYRRREIAVRDVDLTVEQGEFVFLVGSSGAGKSTLLNLISGRIAPNYGSVRIGSEDPRKLFLWRKSRRACLIGTVCQDYGLARKMTVGENLAKVAKAGAPLRGREQYIEARVKKVLGLVGMSGSENYYPVELPINECRRVELARAIINSPSILVLDELTANLDEGGIWDLFQLLDEINRRGTTVIMATRASDYVNIMRRRVVTLVDGKIFGDVQKGKYGDVI